jgi:hypothetical protein
MELTVDGTPVRQKDFSWDVSLNMSGNRGKVKDLIEGFEILYVTDVQVGNAKAASFNNGKFMGISGSKWIRDEHGNVVLDVNTGLPVNDTSTSYYVGNREPTLIGSLNNSFQWKNWNFAFQLDFRVGGDIFNGTDYYMTQAGMSKRSLDRESLTLKGVIEVGRTPDDEPIYEESDTYVYQADQMYQIPTSSGGVQQRYGADIIREYWGTYYPRETANYITKTNWLRLRNVSLSYNLPRDFLSRQSVIKDMSVTLTGTNLFLLTNYKGMDPETSVAGSGVIGSSSVGIDYCGVPATAGFSVGVNLTF